MVKFGIQPIIAITIIVTISFLTLAVSASLLPNLNYGAKPLYTGKAMAKQFTTAHNKIRAFYNEKPLKWNRTLARYARRWANQRVDDCLLLHSPDSPYGENLFWSLRGHWTPYNVVMTWGEEYKYYDPHTNECVNSSVCGHYTQIIWNTTERFGCGRVACNNNKGYLYVCSYDPPGNYYFEGPFGGQFNKSIVNPPKSAIDDDTSTTPAKMAVRRPPDEV